MHGISLIFLCASCFLFLCTSAKLRSARPLKVDVKAHPDDRMNRSPVDVAITVPVRMEDDLGKMASSHHYRLRRSALSSTVDTEEFANPVYKISAFGENIFVRLVPDQVLVAPAFTTTYAWSNDTIRRKQFSHQPILRRCFYKGNVIGQPGSQVAFSICDGLTGSIYTNDYQYTVTPLSQSKTSSSGIKHRIERRSVGAETGAHEHGASCGVRDARHRRRYMRTFFNSPLEDAAHKVRFTALCFWLTVAMQVEISSLDSQAVFGDFAKRTFFCSGRQSSRTRSTIDYRHKRP